MNRLNFTWMGRYYDIFDGANKVGEVYYSINSKQFNLRIESETTFTPEDLRQIMDFIRLENESNNSYA